MYNVEKQIEAVLNENLTNQKLIGMYYQVGSLIKEYQPKQIKDLELYLKNKYGVVIAFTERNLINMIHFSNLNPNLLSKLKDITWKNILVIMKENDESLIDLCLKYKPTKQELLNYLKNNKELKLNLQLELDDTLEELWKLQSEVVK